jgi:hypothetical protein
VLARAAAGQATVKRKQAAAGKHAATANAAFKKCAAGRRPAGRTAAQTEVSPITATFNSEEKATHYAATITSGTKPPAGSFVWKLEVPTDDPTCKTFEAEATLRQGADATMWEARAVWKHAETDGCHHETLQHNGTVSLTVKLPPTTCVVSYLGTSPNTGAPAVCTQKSCADKAAALAAATAELRALEQEKDRLDSKLALAEGFYKLADQLLTTSKAEIGKKAGKSGLALLDAFWKARKDVEALDSAIEQVDEAIATAKTSVENAQKEFDKCERSRHLTTVTANCDAQLGAAAAATARRDALAFVRRTLPAGRIARVVREAAIARANVRRLAVKVPRIRAAAARLDAAAVALAKAQSASKRLDVDLKAARTRATAAAAALASCGG